MIASIFIRSRALFCTLSPFPEFTRRGDNWRQVQETFAVTVPRPPPPHLYVCCSVLQCVAVCCSVLQCVAVCCSVWQCVAVRYSVLQCVAVCCSALQCVAVRCSVL